jgi:hypothetical protein
MIGCGYPKWAKDVQNICSAAHQNVLIHPDDEKSEYWIGVIKGMRYVDESPPKSIAGSPHQNPFQFLNWSGQQSAFRWRIRMFKKHIMQCCDKCGHISQYYYPRIGANNSPNYLTDENGNKLLTEDFHWIATNERYLSLRKDWKKAEVKNICPKCWDNGRGIVVPCTHTWMQEIYEGQRTANDKEGFSLFDRIGVEPDIEERLMFTNIIDRFVADRWVKLGSREHELLTVMFKCPDTEIDQHYDPADNDPPVPATKLLDDPVWGVVAAICMFCEEPCKNGIVGYGKCRNYQLKLATYYGTTQTCINQYRKRLIVKLQNFCAVHKVTFTLPE